MKFLIWLAVVFIGGVVFMGNIYYHHYERAGWVFVAWGLAYFVSLTALVRK